MNKIPPAAVRRYMKEYDETEAEFREWLARQKQTYADLKDKSGSSLEWWIALKMGCSTVASARAAITWAEAQKAEVKNERQEEG